ncbi:MAG: hypothetical protein ETSY2_18975 [Candidatus Entotheonella gemina]|uniref:Uncharacterized protein n=1 Tax=Candidatus Entotheonella gemina TaxID=1429439 RepID=W4M7G6_9BACT|nr:MAG: hypothetical protein ETSY2_18975 [Candidatus Entotheonella gemina]
MCNLSAGARYYCGSQVTAIAVDFAYVAVIVLHYILIVIRRGIMALEPYSIRADSQTMEALGRIAAAMDRSETG